MRASQNPNGSAQKHTKKRFFFYYFISSRRKINSNYLLSTFSRSQVGVCGKRHDTREAPKEEKERRKKTHNKPAEHIERARKGKVWKK